MPRNTRSAKAQERPPLVHPARDAPVALTPTPTPPPGRVGVDGRKATRGRGDVQGGGGPWAPRLLEILHPLSARRCFALGQLGGGEAHRAAARGGGGRLAPAGRRVSRPERGEAEDRFIRTYRGATDAGSSIINPTKTVSAGPSSAGARGLFLGLLRRNPSLCLGGKELFGF